MKKSVAIVITLVIVASILLFDHVIVFLLSGTLPFINITLPATTTLAVMVAGVLTGLALRRRHAVYRNCLELYDEFSRLKKHEKNTGSSKEAIKLPQHRYHQL